MSDSTRAVIDEFFRRTGSDTPPEEIGDMFSDDVDWYVAGDTAVVPWIGRKIGKAGAAEFYRQIRELIRSERFEVADIVIQGDRAIAVGDLESRVRNTGKLIKSEFAFDLTVKNGRIVRFRLFEDSFAVAQAAVS